jgi:hypothetical protein
MTCSRAAIKSAVFFMLTNRFVVNGFNRTRESGGEITPGGNGDMCLTTEEAGE